MKFVAVLPSIFDEMTTHEIISFTVLHVLIPALGLIAFLMLAWKMWKEEGVEAPIPDFFVLFATFGGFLLVILTELFWRWSGMASLGLFYLIGIAPIAMGFIIYWRRKSKVKFRYHRLAVRGAWIYLGVILMSIVVASMVYR